MDNLTGFDAAIHAVFPKTEIQNCIIHQLRNSSKYVSYKDLKALMADLKAVYAAVDEQAALDALDTFGEHWDRKYPKISQSWRNNWANLSTYFKYPQEVRRLIYTTNAIEGFNRQLRKVTKAKSVSPTDDSLLKMLYLVMMDITKKWTGRRQDWSVIHAQIEVFFAERMPDRHYPTGMSTSATSLTSRLPRVMLQTRRQPVLLPAAHHEFCSICTPNDLYTEFGIVPVGITNCHRELSR